MPQPLLKPRVLKRGDTIAVVSLSSGDAATHPVRYEAGKKQLEETFGVRVIETPNALKPEEWIGQNPQARAEDLMGAFADPSVAAIVAASGGDDSVRLLPYYDFDLMRANPKVFLGMSDITVSHFACRRAGLVSFYGPNIMTSFAENSGMMPFQVDSLRRILFQTQPIGVLAPNTQGWTREETDWDDEEAQARPRYRQASEPWRWLQGEGAREGRLIGGCVEIMELLRGTDLWPEADAFDGAILMLETSDEMPPPSILTRALRVYARMGILENLSGILLGRPGGMMPTEEFSEYEDAVMRVVQGEEKLDLPVVGRMDFGHTDPTLVMPLGARARIDCDTREVSILESAMQEPTQGE